MYDHKQGDDYRAVNEYVWEAYYRFYGGGPPIVRSANDIYSTPCICKFNKNIDMSKYYDFEVRVMSKRKKEEATKRPKSNK
jgi:hypothetical protein